MYNYIAKHILENDKENLTEPPTNKEKRGSGGGFSLLKPSNSDTFLALARRASNASRELEDDEANGVGERGKIIMKTRKYGPLNGK